MKKRIIGILSTVLMLALLLSCGAAAAEIDDAIALISPEVPDTLQIRVNGYLVSYPDAQPYVDANKRTMVPIRFVAEALGAAVEWNNGLQAAVITKNDIRIEVPIDSRTLRVWHGNEISTVEMDTEAVLRDCRTFVPVRFVAEAMGAWVDYCDTFKTVGIFQDVLTADEIETLQAYPYTIGDNEISYEYEKKMRDDKELILFYGTDRESFDNFANAREHLYRWSKVIMSGDFYFDDIECTYTSDNLESFYDTVLSEVRDELNFDSENISISFRTDSSCIYQPDGFNGFTCTVRGYAYLTTYRIENIHEEVSRIVGLGFTQSILNKTVVIPVDIHFSTMRGYQLDIYDIVPLASQTLVED